jgi:receptor protein-tyrosine kinase
LRDTDQLERIYQLPLLGVVPQSSDLARTRRWSETGALEVGPESESFNLIRAHLRYFNVDSELRTILVSSAGPGDGKTTVAFRLAAAAAATGSRTLLLEADLRRPTVHNHVPVDRGIGLSDVLIGAVPFSEAVQGVELESFGGQSRRSLEVLFAGTLPPNPAELIESSAMKRLVADVRDTYEFVVIDSPPITAVSDAFPLLLSVDGVIVVARLGQDRRFAERAHDIFQEVGAPMLGIVVNGSKARESDPYTYSYAADIQHGPTKETDEDRPPAVSAQQRPTRETDVERPPTVDVS